MKTQIGYLGPVGTYSHVVAEQRFGKRASLIPHPDILAVCRFVSRHPNRLGIIPIENSSGGAIYETVDVLLLNRPCVYVREELSLNVNLALLGRSEEPIKTLYSHFAPLEHCSKWIRRHLPHAQRRALNSTALAALKASEETGAAALGSRRLAEIYNLKVLQYPVQADIPNLTTFLLISGKKSLPTLSPNPKTSLAVKLPNVPGSLCTFLEAFRDHDVNLSRLISRPIRGCFKEYAFLIDVQGHTGIPKVQAALRQARKVSMQLRIVGSYPCLAPYTS